MQIWQNLATLQIFKIFVHFSVGLSSNWQNLEPSLANGSGQILNNLTSHFALGSHAKLWLQDRSQWTRSFQKNKFLQETSCRFHCELHIQFLQVKIWLLSLKCSARSVWPDWAIFKVLYKSSPNSYVFWGSFEKQHFGWLLGNFLKN